jgi:NAD(P)-dependent dehydrogenase (short-subunit alcohol dehydrogenase family)
MAAPNYGLEGKVALVTGAASGIGRATAELFAAQGARLVTSDVEEGAGAEVVERLGEAGGSASFVAADVRDDEALAPEITLTRKREVSTRPVVSPPFDSFIPLSDDAA